MLKRALATLLALALATGGLLAAPAPASALGEADYLAAAMLLSKYKLVQGDELGLRLSDDIKRAELAKLIVHALAMESQVGDYTDRNDFVDTRGHWADGYIALAKRIGLMRGYPGGDFRPNAPISNAEVITVMARLVGLEASQEPWPNTYVRPARDAGIIPADMTAVSDLQGAATRGNVFVLLQHTLADVKNYAGQTLLQRYLDKTPPAITLDPQPQQTADAVLLVSGTVYDGSSVRINGSEVPLEYGAFQYDLPLRMGPNTIRVQAFDEAGNMAEKTAQVTRIPGVAASIELQGPSAVAAGQTAQFTLRVKDKNGEELSAKQAEATISPNLGSFDPATAKFTAGAQLGKANITVMAGSALTTAAIEVVTGSLSRIAVAPDDVQLGPDQTQNFMVTGYDSQGNPVAVSDVSWSATGGAISNTGSFKNGATPTNVTITATAGGRSATAIVRPLNYKVASVQVTPPTQGTILRADRLSQTSMTATLVDSAGAVVTDYTGSVTVTSSAPGSIGPTQSSWPVVNGVASIKLQTGATAGTATIAVATNLGKTGSASVTVTPQQIQTVRLTGSLYPTEQGTTKGIVEALALDQGGNPMVSPLNQTMILRLTIAPAGGVFITNNNSTEDMPMGALDPDTGDIRARAEILYTAGGGTLTISGSVTTANLSYVGVLAGAFIGGPVGPPAQVGIESVPETVAGQLRVVAVNLVDKDGFGVASIPAGYSVTLRDQNGATWGPNPCPCNPVGHLTFDVTQTVAGNYTYTATLLPGGHTAANATRVVPDRVSAITLTATPASVPADNASAAVLKAELWDQYGNKVTAGSYPITFTKNTSTGATQAFATRVVGSVGGEAEVTVTAGTVVAVETYGVSVPNPVIGPVPLPPSTATANVTSLGATPQRLVLSYPDTNGNVGTAGLPVTVRVSVVDAQGSLLTYDSGRAVTLTVRNPAPLKETTYSGLTQGGVVDFKVNRADSGTMAVKAETAGLIKGLSVGYGGASQDLVIQPGVTTAIKLNADLTTIKADAGKSYSVVTVNLLDPNGNVTTNQTGLPINVTLAVTPSALTYGYFAVNDLSTGFQVNTKTVTIQPGASSGSSVKFFSKSTSGNSTIQGSTLDGGSSSVAITTTSVGAVSALKVDPVQSVVLEPYASADGAVTGQTVTVTAVDTSSRRVTDFGAAGETISLTIDQASDARIVAYWDPNLRTWKSTDTALGNGVGDYPTILAVAADRGQAIFRVRAAAAGTAVYRLGYGSKASVASATGDFTPAAPDHLLLQVARRTITGGGDQVAVQVRVRDPYGNTLTGVTGPIQFAITAGGTAGALLASTADLVNGVATVYFQSNLNVAANTTVTVDAWSTSLWSSGAHIGMAATPATDQFVVDGTPSLAAFDVNNAGATVGANQGDQIIFTFSENIDAATIPATSTTTVKFDTTTSAITFQGGPGLGTIYLWPGALTAEGTFAVSSISEAGATVTVTLGAQVSGGPALTSFNRNSGTTGTASMNGSLRDLAGSGAYGPFPITVNGDF